MISILHNRSFTDEVLTTTMFLVEQTFNANPQTVANDGPNLSLRIFLTSINRIEVTFFLYNRATIGFNEVVRQFETGEKPGRRKTRELGCNILVELGLFSSRKKPYIDTDFDVYSAHMSFPNEPSGGPNCFTPQVLTDLFAMLNGETGVKPFEFASGYCERKIDSLN